MILLIVAAVVSAALLGFGAAFLIYRVKPQPFTGIRRFHVIMHTDNGSQARRLYERLLPKGDGVVEFFDKEVCRGSKEA